MMLLRKVLRDLRQNAVQFLAIYIMTLLALLVASGFDASDYGVYLSASEYLTDQNFKDLNIEGRYFGHEDIAMLEQMDGVAYVNGIRHGTGKTVLDRERPLVISYIDGNEVSSMLLTEGEPYTPGSSGVWVEALFAEPMGIRPGDTLTITTENTTFQETVRGLVYSPEYLYYIPNSTYTEPEYGTHGFVIMDIQEAPGTDKQFDQLIVDLGDVHGQGGSLTDAEKAVMRDMRDRITRKFDDPGLLVKLKTEDDIYDEYVGAINSTGAITTVFPLIFMLVAVLGIITTMARLTGKQRTVIGTMKALGFSDKQITLHYMCYSVIVAILGCISGVVIGVNTLGVYLNDLNDYYYQNPYICLKLTGKSFYMSILAVGLSVLVTWLSTHKLLVQNASEILRPEPPKASGAGALEKTPLWKRLGFTTRWNIRDVYRNKMRTMASITGILVCSLLLYTATGFYECLACQSDWMYGELIRAEYRISFEDGVSRGTVYDYAREYEGQMVEEVSTTLYSDTTDSVRPMIVLDQGNMFWVEDEDLNYTDLPKDGIALTSRLTELLNVSVGDTLRWKIAGNEKMYSAPVRMIVRQASDQGILMSREYWEQIGGDFAPNLVYTRRTVPAELKNRPEVSSADSIETLKTALENANMMGYTLTTIMVVMAVVMGVIVLYNLGVLSYIEKVREIATLKVLGFQTGDIRRILLQQNLTVTAVGAVLGVPLGIIMLQVVVDLFMGEDGDLVVRFRPMPYVYAILGTFVVSVLVNLFITLKVKKIDMVEALKGVE
ncbi:MAG: FtsX-like permease family protein [Lachnospiraceae bacterium]|nr:FtsX-like permease family protein [Lachnospiraceae bacterium]